MDSSFTLRRIALRLFLGELEERDAAKRDVRVELVVEADRPELRAAHEPLAMPFQDPPPDREGLQRLGRKVG